MRSNDIYPMTRKILYIATVQEWKFRKSFETNTFFQNVLKSFRDKATPFLYISI